MYIDKWENESVEFTIENTVKMTAPDSYLVHTEHICGSPDHKDKVVRYKGVVSHRRNSLVFKWGPT